MSDIRSFRWLALLLLASGIALLMTGLVLVEPAAAQCGSSATSCKNCHEVNAEYPVNASGDWHVSHAFGDFCAFCHAGNVQAVEADAAHEGMVYPLADIEGSCASCHPDDLQELAEVYAVALGVTLDASNGGGGADSGSDPNDIPSEPIAAPGERNASGALIDYNRRYEIEALGRFDDSQLGNWILWGFLGGLTMFGGVLVWRFEGLGKLWDTLRQPMEAPEWLREAYASGDYAITGPVTGKLPSRHDDDDDND